MQVPVWLIYERQTYKGGGAHPRAAPLCRFFSLSKLIELLLKSRILPFNPFCLAGALKNYILGTLDLRKMTLYFSDWDLNMFCSRLSSALHLNCKRHNLVALRGAKIHRNTACESTKVTF